MEGESSISSRTQKHQCGFEDLAQLVEYRDLIPSGTQTVFKVTTGYTAKCDAGLDNRRNCLKQCPSHGRGVTSGVFVLKAVEE